MNAWEARRSGARDEDGGRPPAFERDRARIIHSAAFRRLQAKTQVLGIGEGDFHRTRLTHTLEVAQIGRGIVSQMSRDPDVDQSVKENLPCEALIEAVCLAHDLGHPPFGHGGERALDFIMRNHGGFEGNGQTLRILARLEPHTEEFGLDPTRRTLLGILKYPAAYDDVVVHDASIDCPRPPVGWHAPKCYLDCEREVVNWVLEELSDSDRRRFVSFREQKDANDVKVHSKTQFKSLDTSIMELADDLAYGVHDLEDGVALDLIVRQDWEAEGLDELANLLGLTEAKEKLFSGDNNQRRQIVSDMVHTLMRHLSTISDDKFEEPLLRHNVVLSSKGKPFLKGLKALTRKRLIERVQVRTLEWRGQELVRELFEAYETHGIELMPPKGALKRLLLCGNDDITCRRRAICDFIAGMTDEYAMRMYERLFVPRQRNIFERL